MRDRAPILFLLDTGVPVSELINLRISDNDFRLGTAVVQDKVRLDSGRTSHPAGASFGTVLRICDTVWEWPADRFDFDLYAESPSYNPVGTEPGDNKVVQGGTWFDTPNFATVAVRFPAPPSESIDSVGFRCAMSVNPQYLGWRRSGTRVERLAWYMQ